MKDGNYIANIVDESPANTTRALRCKKPHGFHHTTTTTTPMALPEPPIPVQLFGDRVGGIDVTLGCNDFDTNHDGIVQVNVYRATAFGGPYTLIGNFSLPDNNTFFDFSLPETSQFYYVLKTLGDGITYQAAESGPSAVICALLFPESVMVDPILANEADLAWTYPAPAPQQDYQLQWSTDPDFGTYTEAILNQNAVTAAITGLDSETQYFFRIRARDSNTCVSEWTAGDFTTTA